MTDRELMQQALDALEHEAQKGNDDAYRVERDALRAAIEQAQPELEQAMTDAIIGGTGVMLGDKRIDPASIYRQPEQAQEPVAWVGPSWLNPETRTWESDSFESIQIEGWIPLYTAPRQWQGLTDEEIAEIAATPAAIPGSYVHSFARAIEAKLREKNR